MKLRPIFATVLLGLAFTGCATFNDQEIGPDSPDWRLAQWSANLQGQPSVLAPQDVIELTRRGVADELIIRQIQDTSVDYVLTKERR